MNTQIRHAREHRPALCEPIVQELYHTLDNIIRFCTSSQNNTVTLFTFEQRLWPLVASLGRLFLLLFLTCRHRRLDLSSWRKQGYRLKEEEASRTIETRFGLICYVRAYLLPKKGRGNGLHPLDIALGLTRDGFSPWIIQLVTRLATRMSYGAATLVCRMTLGWSPSTEAIEHLVLGLGRHAAPFMMACAPPEEDGEILIIEVDGKCTPTATAEELAKRRRPRKPRHGSGCTCGCQRHRGKQQRQRRGSRNRRKKGDKSKNGREIVLVVMYTLKRGEDGRLHGPINKKVWGTYAGKKAIAQWAREQATKRGFPPETKKTVEIVIDGAKSLYKALRDEFAKAWFTLDVRHVEEKLWLAGRVLYAEGSEELRDWVKQLQEHLYGGRVKVVIKRLEKALGGLSSRGPEIGGKRKTLEGVINYLRRRVRMMRYKELLERDLVIASGIVEGAARYVVGERMDCAGMRWIAGRAEALLQLRCVELNGDWEKFWNYTQSELHKKLQGGEVVQIRTNEPLPTKKGHVK